MVASTPVERFEANIRKGDGCWLWIGSFTQTGIPSFDKEPARRRAYKLYVGDIPDGTHVLSSCRERLCVNPSHLILSSKSGGSYSDKDKHGEQHDNSNVERIRTGYLPHSDFIAESLSMFRGVDWDETRTERLTTTLHWPWPSGDPIPYDDGVYRVPDTLVRPSIFRSIIISKPIDRTARRVSCDKQQTPCPYCNRWFRNPAALTIHLEESHEVEARYVSSDTRLGILHEEMTEFKRIDQMKQVEAEEQSLLTEMINWL